MNRDPYFNPPANIDFTPEDPERGLAIGVSRGDMPPSADHTDAPRGATVNIDPYHDQLGRFTTGPGMGARRTTSQELGARRMDYTQVTEFPSATPVSTLSGSPASTPSAARTSTPASSPSGSPASSPSRTPASTPPGTPASTPPGTPISLSFTKGGSAIQNALYLLNIDTERKPGPGGIYLTHYGPGKKKHGWDPYHDSNSDEGIGNHGNKLTKYSLSISQDLVKAAGLVHGSPVYIDGHFIGFYDDTLKKEGRIDIYDHENVAGTYWSGMVWGAKLSSKP